MSVCLSVLAGSLRQRPTFRKSRSAQQDGAHIDRRIARLFSKFCTYVVQSRIVQAANVMSLNNIVTMKVIVTLAKARNSAGNTKGWDLSAVRLATVRVTEPPLQQKLRKVRHDLLCKVKVMSVSTSWRRIAVDPFVLNLSTRWSLLVSLNLRPLYPRHRTRIRIKQEAWVGRRASLDGFLWEKNLLPLPGKWIPNCLACWLSLYRLS